MILRHVMGRSGDGKNSLRLALLISTTLDSELNRLVANLGQVAIIHVRPCIVR